jgi:predicted anti-sigma-YlaC factor YlaD
MTCSRAAELISHELDAPLPLAARVGLAVHARLCGACRRYRRQLAALDRAAAELVREPVESSTLPPAAEARLRAAVVARLRPSDGDEKNSV